mgnify:CR=1 FL=1
MSDGHEAFRADTKRGVFRNAARNILVIAGAAGTAQLIAFAAAPLLTRLYAPEAFGRFAVFAAAATILYPLATLRYEWAIVLPAEEDAASKVLALCLVLLAGFSVLIAAAASLASMLAPWLVNWSGVSWVDLLLLPLAIAAFSLNGIATSWLMRERAFGQIAQIRFVTTTSVIATQLILGLLVGGSTSLIIGFAAGYLLGVAVQTPRLRLPLSRSLSHLQLGALRPVARDYRRFATITAPSNAINAVGSQLPSLAFPALYGFTASGQFSLAQRVLSQPTTLVGQAVNQVFWSDAARLVREEPASLYPLFIRLNVILFALMAPAFLLVWIGPDLFSVVFGPPWREAGRFAGIFIFASFFGLAAQGTTALHVYGLNHWMGAWEMLQLALVSIALVAAAAMELGPLGCVGALSVALVLANVTLLALNSVAVRRAGSTTTGHRSHAPRPEKDVILHESGPAT